MTLFLILALIVCFLIGCAFGFLHASCCRKNRTAKNFLIRKLDRAIAQNP